MKKLVQKIAIAFSLCEQTIRAAFAPPSTLPSWKWMEENIELDNTSALPGKYACDLFPCVKLFSKYADNPRTRRQIVMVSAQSTKTQTAINKLIHVIAEDPGPAMWIMADADNTKEFAQKRLFPAVEQCKATADLVPKERNKRNKKLIQFASMNLMLRGSVSRTGLQSDPVRYIFCDERREWKPGAIELVRKRTRTFANFLEISMGTAGNENDELHSDFLEGNQIFIHWHCPKCKHSQPFRFSRRASVLFPNERECGGVVWDTNEKTKPGGQWIERDGAKIYVGGKWDYDEVKKLSRYECENPKCRTRFHNAEKIKLLKSWHEYVANPNASAGMISMHWSALYMPFQSCDWGEIAVEFLKANERAKLGDLMPLIAFVTETLGEPWDELKFFQPRKTNVSLSDYSLAGKDLSPGKFWEKEATRFMGVDVQENHYWFVCRAFSENGESRLVDCGRLETDGQVRDKQIALAVEDERTVLDCAYDMPRVGELCCAFGWRMMRGDDHVAFPHYENKERILRVYSEPKEYDPFSGREHPRKFMRALFVRWSNPSIKDFLARLENGQGVYWGVPSDVSQTYLDQRNSERKQTKKNKLTGRMETKWVTVGSKDSSKGKGPHMRDCECMCLTSAIIDSRMDGEAVLPEKPLQENPEEQSHAE